MATSFRQRLRDQDEPLQARPPAPPSSPAGITDEEWRRLEAAYALSPRQSVVARGIIDGSKLSAIASRMNLSLGTVKTHTQRLYHRLGIHDQRELAVALLSALLRLRRH